jgi:hypothetical protein
LINLSQQAHFNRPQKIIIPKKLMTHTPSRKNLLNEERPKFEIGVELKINGHVDEKKFKPAKLNVNVKKFQSRTEFLDVSMTHSNSYQRMPTVKGSRHLGGIIGSKLNFNQHEETKNTQKSVDLREVLNNFTVTADDRGNKEVLLNFTQKKVGSFPDESAYAQSPSNLEHSPVIVNTESHIKFTRSNGTSPIASNDEN